MRALTSDLLLVDLKLPPTSTFTYLQSSSSIDSASSGFRRTRRASKGVVASAGSGSSFWASVIRRPADKFSGGNGSMPDLTNGATTSWCVVDAELEMFLELLPLRMRRELNKHEEIGELIEVVMDLGRKPIARFPSGDWMISEHPVKADDLRHAISKVGNFSDDNRSGIDSSLHRISAIRNRKMQIIGLTCRVGRAVSGSAETLRDLVERGGSILVIGPPGVGKTTLIREISRMLADEYQKRVIIVDTSNEIGGDGDVPHSGIGRSRRMQVPNVHMQHNVMIEAVENHMPETIIIDEIGTELEALAASTIAQRGVQLVGTAHGMTIDNIIKNPSLQNLVGGVESVTLGDEEARKRKVQKTILERKGPPTFTCAIEMISKTECRVHHRLDASIDAILAGKSPLFEVRRMHNGDSDFMKDSPLLETENVERNELTIPEHLSSFVESDDQEQDYFFSKPKTRDMHQSSFKKRSPISVYSYKILDTDVLEVAAAMGLEEQIDVTDDIGAADAILACSSEMKANPGIRGIAKFHRLPVFVIKSNTMAQMVKALRMILGRVTKRSAQKQPDERYADIEVEDDSPKRKPSLEEIDALEEVRLAIEYIVIPGGEPVELLPRRSDIIARQLELVESYQLSAENSGTELNPRLQILPLRLNKKVSNLSKYATTGRRRLDLKPMRSGSGIIGGTSINKLPLLPE